MWSQTERRTWWAIAALALAVGACGPEDTGSAALALRFEGPGPGGATRGQLTGVVQTIRVDVRAGEQLLRQAVFDYDDMQGAVTGIPAGAGRTFVVEALFVNTVVYRGTSPGVTIRAGQETPVPVTLEPAYTEDVYAPAAVTDLAAAPTGGNVRITWTAVGNDGLVGQAATSDLRWSEATIQSANFEAANRVAGVPVPGPVGAAEQFLVSGLTPGRTYHFAMRVNDAAGNASALSNEAIAQLSGSDTTAPAAIADLSVSAVDRSSVTLAWTAPGDDGASGQVEQYDVRYSTAPIDADNFGQATPFPGPASPVAGGQAESLRVTGLTLGQSYHFAVKAADEVPNWAELSNVVSGQPADTIPPAAVVLSELSLTNTSVTLGWTAPGDDGNVGSAALYELRVSGAPIDEGNFGAATQVPGLPAPGSAGSAESFTVPSLTELVPYYFALRTLDGAGNPSPISNVVRSVPGQQDTTPPGAVVDLAVVDAGETSLTLEWTAPGDDGALGSVSGYDLRWAGAAIDSEALFAAATPVTWPAGTALVDGGLLQAVVVDGLTLGQTYHFALKAVDNVGNTSALSNTDFGATLDLTPPEAVVDLLATALDDTSISLGWSAPADNDATGRAASYEIRSSLAPIDALNFDAADPVANPPVPGAAGAPEAITVGSLSLGVTYHFALRSLDAAGNPSALSNPASAAPGAQDTTPPGAVVDLAAAAWSETEVELTFTAPGDDGATGSVTAYDLRMSDQPILDEAGFTAATPFAWPGGTPIVAGGGNQSVVVTGLALGTSYHFALKAVDNSGNWSALSNDAPGAPADLVPPGAIADLTSVFIDVGQVDLEWTAPHEDGAAGGAAAAYDLRYSLADITTDDEFDLATPWTTGMPSPGLPDAVDGVSVTGLAAGTYYFSIKARDAAGNWSALPAALAVPVP